MCLIYLTPQSIVLLTTIEKKGIDYFIDYKITTFTKSSLKWESNTNNNAKFTKIN